MKKLLIFALTLATLSGETWVIAGSASKHFVPGDWNEQHNAVGVVQSIDSEWFDSVTVSTFKNSMYQQSNLIAGVKEYCSGIWCTNVQFGFLNGYIPNDGGYFPVVLPSVGIKTKWAALDISSSTRDVIAVLRIRIY